MRKLSGLIMLLLLSVVLVACTGDEDEPEPTAPPVSTRIVENTPAATESADDEPGTPTIVVNEATPEAGGVTATPGMMNEATPASQASTPVVENATPAATPVLDATPVTAITASPVATPQVSGSPDATPAATPNDAASAQPALVAPVAADVTETPVVMVELSGTIVLNGVANETYILTDEGCVGLGQYSDLRQGRQVVVRDETGTIVSVTELGASDDEDRCAWDFVVQVPESAFYSVSIPMTFEHVFPKGQVSANGGKVVIELP